MHTNRQENVGTVTGGPPRDRETESRGRLSPQLYVPTSPRLKNLAGSSNGGSLYTTLNPTSASQTAKIRRQTIEDIRGQLNTPSISKSREQWREQSPNERQLVQNEFGPSTGTRDVEVPSTENLLSFGYPKYHCHTFHEEESEFLH